MVAYEFFDSTSREDSLKNKNKPLRDKLQDSLDNYNNYIDVDDSVMQALFQDMRTIYQDTSKSVEDRQKDIQSLTKLLKQAMPEENAIILTKLKNVNDTSNSNVKKIKEYSDQLKDQILSEDQGISTALPGHPNSRMKDEASNYNARLNEQANEEKKLLDQMLAHEGEYEDAKLKRKSYRLQSAIYSIVFIIIVGLLIRAVLTTQSNAIETLILFLVVAFIIYYLIEYIF